MLKNIIAVFIQINLDCEKNGDQVVPLTKENVDYYIEQMENMDYSEKAIHVFEEYLLTQ